MPVRIENVRHWISLHFFESPIAADRSAVFLERWGSWPRARGGGGGGGGVRDRGSVTVTSSTEATRDIVSCRMHPWRTECWRWSSDAGRHGDGPGCLHRRVPLFCFHLQGRQGEAFESCAPVQEASPPGREWDQRGKPCRKVCFGVYFSSLGCGLTFATKYQLHKHKANEGHKFATRGRPTFKK